MKRFFSALLCLCLILSLAGPALAAGAEVTSIDLQVEGMPAPMIGYAFSLPTSAAVTGSGCRTEDAGHIYDGSIPQVDGQPDPNYEDDPAWEITSQEIPDIYSDYYYACDVYAEEGRTISPEAAVTVNGRPADSVRHISSTQIRVIYLLGVREAIRLEMEQPEAALKINEPSSLKLILTNQGTRPESLADCSIAEGYDKFLTHDELPLGGILNPGESRIVELPCTVNPTPEICNREPVANMSISLRLTRNWETISHAGVMLPVEALPQEYRTGHLRFLDAEGREVSEVYTQDTYLLEMSFTNHFDFSMTVFPYNSEGGMQSFFFYTGNEAVAREIQLPVHGQLPTVEPGQTVSLRTPLDLTNYLQVFPNGGSHQVCFDLVYVVSPDELLMLDVELTPLTVHVGRDPAQPEAPGFSDVPANAYYANAVQWAVDSGITGGTGPNTFGPNDPCTRAHAVSFIWKLHGSQEPQSQDNPFWDVPENAYYTKPVLWAVENGITGGMGGGKFGVGDPCTRAQIVSFLWSAAGKPAASIDNPFRDVAPGKYYEQAVLWAVENGITTGTGDDTFAPDEVCTRGQIVCFLQKAAF